MNNHLNNARLANLLGALAIHVSDCIKNITEEAAGFSGSIPATLVQINSFSDGSFENLQSALGTTQSATTKVVQKMNQHGLLELKRNTEDKRVIDLFLSAKGEEAYNKVISARETLLCELTANLDDMEKSQLTRILEKLLAQTINTRASSDRACRLCDLNACPQDICPAEPNCTIYTR